MVKKYQRLTFYERIEIEKLLSNGHSVAYIATRLNRTKTTISRDVKHFGREAYTARNCKLKSCRSGFPALLLHSVHLSRRLFSTGKMAVSGSFNKYCCTRSKQWFRQKVKMATIVSGGYFDECIVLTVSG